MYFLPINYKCGKCDFEMEYTQSHSYEFLPISKDGKPFCHKCLIEFITKNIPVMDQIKDT